MTKHWAIAFGVLGLILGVVIAAAANVNRQPDVSDGIHYHAGFQVYVNDQRQDFSDLKYMNQEPCTDKPDPDHTPEEEQIEKAHLHDLVADVVHVHRAGATWHDLFVNMGYDFPADSSRIAYINGERIEDDILDHPINKDDSVVIFVGTNTDIDTKLAGAVTLAHIRDIESHSEACGVN